MPQKPAIFLDRDNTLIRDDGYIFEIEKFAWINGAAAALKRFHQAGLPVFIVTNQGGIGRGIFTESEMHRFNDHLIDAAEKAGGAITDIAFCPHHPRSPDQQWRRRVVAANPNRGCCLILRKNGRLTLVLR